MYYLKLCGVLFAGIFIFPFDVLVGGFGYALEEYKSDYRYFKRR